MKIRIRGNSLRLRLTQAEVASFAEKGIVEDCIHFGKTSGNSLTYSMSVAKVNNLEARYWPGKIEVLVPSQMALQWTSTDMVGFETPDDTGDPENLKILVEKDWQCLKARPDEDESDMFPHPEETGANC